MGALIPFKVKDHALIVQWSKNSKSKENQIVKEKNPKSEIEDESLNEGSMEKFKNKGSTSKCSYCSEGFHHEKKCFKKNMDIMSHLLEKHKIKVLDELKKLVDSSEALS